MRGSCPRCASAPSPASHRADPLAAGPWHPHAPPPVRSRRAAAAGDVPAVRHRPLARQPRGAHGRFGNVRRQPRPADHRGVAQPGTAGHRRTLAGGVAGGDGRRRLRRGGPYGGAARQRWTARRDHSRADAARGRLRTGADRSDTQPPGHRRSARADGAAPASSRRRAVANPQRRLLRHRLSLPDRRRSGRSS